jgi:hypothetical protein
MATITAMHAAGKTMQNLDVYPPLRGCFMFSKNGECYDKLFKHFWRSEIARSHESTRFE